MDFDLRKRAPSEDVWPSGVASDDLVATLPPLAQEKIRQSGKPAVLNPLTEEDARTALGLIAEMSLAVETEKSDYNASRGTLRAVCDFFLGTGKDDLFLTLPDAREAVGRALGISNAQEILEKLWKAGLIEIHDFIPDGENVAVILERIKEVVTVTERGKILLDVRNQPEALVQS